MNWIALYILLCGLGFVSAPMWLPVVKWVQSVTKPITHMSETPDQYEQRLREWQDSGKPPKLAHQSDDWQCGQCGHDKYVVFATSGFVNNIRRKCVRCSTIHMKRPKEAVRPMWLPVDEQSPRLTGHYITGPEG